MLLFGYKRGYVYVFIYVYVCMLDVNVFIYFLYVGVKLGKVNGGYVRKWFWI